MTNDTDEITAAAFDDWLSNATLAQGSVEILQNPALLSEWDDLLRRHQRAATVAAGEAGIADDNPVAALEAEAEILLARIEASRTTIHVRALLPDDLAAIMAAHPVKPGPRFSREIPSVQPNPTDRQAEAFLAAYKAYADALDRWQQEHAAEIDAHRQDTMKALEAQGAEKVARAIVRMEQGGRTITSSLTADQVIAMAKRIGDAQMKLITSKIDEVSAAAPEVPAGFLSRTSGSDRISSAG